MTIIKEMGTSWGPAKCPHKIKTLRYSFHTHKKKCTFHNDVKRRRHQRNIAKEVIT